MFRKMNRLMQILKVGICRPVQPLRYKSGKEMVKIDRSRRSPSFCDICKRAPDPKTCFSMDDITIEQGNQRHAWMVKPFLYSHHWPREPSVTGLWMSLNSAYLCTLTEKYANSGDCFFAFMRQSKTDERKLVGFLCGNITFPWVADELEEWAHLTSYLPDRHRMYFNAHCLRSPNLFKKYDCGYIYEIQVLTTAPEVTGQGVATLLLRTALQHSKELRHPLTQVVATNYYVDKICKKCGMQSAWSMKYSDFVDESGRNVFYPRAPHETVSIFVKPV